MMGKRSPNPQLAKIHRSYTIEAVASRYEVHKNTVRQWLKQGLTPIDNKRPVLILGRHLREFLRTKRQKNKRTCRPGEIYCVKCHEPRSPAGAMVDYQAATKTLGNLIGICPCCDTMMYRRVNPTKLEQVRGKLDVRLPQAQRRINERASLSLNSDLTQEVENHENP